MMLSVHKVSRVIFVVLILLLGVPVTSHAEEEPGVLREVGAWASAASTTFGGEFIEESPADRIPVLGFAAGAFARLQFLRVSGLWLGLQPELLYVPRGANVELDGIYIGNFRAKYLEIPILGRIESPALGPAAFYVVAGPSLGVLLSAQSGDMDGDVSDAEDTSRLDIAFAAGLGATVTVTSRIALNLETRYVHGFLTVDDTGESEILNRGILFLLGVSARFGIEEPASLED